MKVAVLSEALNGKGLGHLVRCFSVGEAFRELGLAVHYFAHLDSTITLPPELRRFELVEWINLSNLDSLNFEIIVCDSYVASQEVYKTLEEKSKLLAFFDDYKRIDYPKGAIINGAFGAPSFGYKLFSGVSHCLGVDYAPLRPAFWDVDYTERNQENSEILIILGGHDVRNLAGRILEFLSMRIAHAHFSVITGDAQSSIQLFSSKISCTVHSNLTGLEVSNLMRRSSIVITAAGSTIFEVLRFHSHLVAVGVAVNQKKNCEDLVTLGIMREVLWWNDCEILEKIYSSVIEKLAMPNKNKSPLVDGQGARRIVRTLIGQMN